jgi:hypothetical protein
MTMVGIQRPFTHDFSTRCWGHNFTITEIKKGGRRIKGHMWVSPKLAVGDFLILPNGPDETTRYQVIKAHWVGNVDDMYFFTAKFAPREDIP